MSEPSKSLSPDTLLFLEQVRRRYHTRERVALFQEDKKDLVILFDRNPMADWMLYEFTNEIFPDVSLIMNTDYDICGVYIAFDISQYMSMRLYMEYQRIYPSFAAKQNKLRSPIEIEIIWEYITEYFVTAQTAEMSELYKRFEQLLHKKIVGINVWIPLYEEVQLTMH
jgi:hypothetical protein